MGKNTNRIRGGDRSGISNSNAITCTTTSTAAATATIKRAILIASLPTIAANALGENTEGPLSLPRGNTNAIVYSYGGSIAPGTAVATITTFAITCAALASIPADLFP